MRQTQPTAKKRATSVDLMHQIVRLHGRTLCSGQRNRRSVVDQNVDAAKLLHGFVDRALHLFFNSNVDTDRQRLATGSFDLLTGRIYGSFELGVLLLRFRGDSHIGALSRESNRDRLSDAATRASNENSLILEHSMNCGGELLNCLNENLM